MRVNQAHAATPRAATTPQTDNTPCDAQSPTRPLTYAIEISFSVESSSFKLTKCAYNDLISSGVTAKAGEQTPGGRRVGVHAARQNEHPQINSHDGHQNPSGAAHRATVARRG